MRTGFDVALERSRADYDRGLLESLYPVAPVRAGWERTAASESPSFWLGLRHGYDAIVRGELRREGAQAV